MESSFFDAVKKRRTRYALSKDPVNSDERIQEIVSEAVKHAPSAFNSQSARVVVLLGEQHDRLWDIVKSELKKIMQELFDEHAWGRKTTAAIVAAKEKYLAGEEGKLAEIIDLARQLGSFYPKHIEKEDKHFFYPCQEYFGKDEQSKMLAEFWEFDRKMIHEKYNKVFDEYSSLSLE